VYVAAMGDITITTLVFWERWCAVNHHWECPCEDLGCFLSGQPEAVESRNLPHCLLKGNRTEEVCPSLISLTVSVDVKHHVYLRRSIRGPLERNELQNIHTINF